MGDGGAALDGGDGGAALDRGAALDESAPLLPHSPYLPYIPYPPYLPYYSHSKAHQFVVRRGNELGAEDDLLSQQIFVVRNASSATLGKNFRRWAVLEVLLIVGIFSRGRNRPFITTNLVHLQDSQECRLWHLYRTNLTHTLLTRLLLLQQLTLT